MLFCDDTALYADFTGFYVIEVKMVLYTLWSLGRHYMQ